MAVDFSSYDIPKTKYGRLLAHYLQNDGTQIMNKVRFTYDRINNYKDRVVEFWRLFDIDYLENLYITWKRANPALDDSEWIYTNFLENISKGYQITREYYSYYAIDQELETTNILLNNLNMIRLLKIKRASVGYDGTRENLIQILQNALNNKYSNDANSRINFVLKTQTDENYHASLFVYIVKPSTDVGDIIWTDYDYYLMKDGQYFVQLLGITTDFEAIDADTLVFDISNYDESKYK